MPDNAFQEDAFQTRTFLLTDVKGSTSLWEQYPGAMSQAMARHDALVERVTGAYHGNTVRPRGEGDSRFLVFQRAMDGVRAAVAIQEAVQAEPWPEGISFAVRMALNTGEGEYRDGDFYGTAVNRCARLRGLAHAGQVLISQSTYEMVIDHLPEGYEIQDLGEHLLRGLNRPERVYQIVAPGLPATFPPLVTEDQGVSPIPLDITGLKPGFLEAEPQEKAAEPTVFVDREAEMAWLNTALGLALRGEGRVVFIGGGPGRGKTALADNFVQQSIRKNPELIFARGVCHAYSGVGDPYGPFREVFGMLTGDLEPYWASGLISSQIARSGWEFVPATLEALLKHGPHLPGIFVDPKALMSRAVSVFDEDSPLLHNLLRSLSRQSEPAADLEQGYLFEQYTNVTLALAKLRPLILVLDDLQWTDTSSAGLLFHLGRRLAGARILVICTYRPEEVALGQVSHRIQSERAERHPLEKLLAEFKRKYGDIILDLSDPSRQHGRSFVDAYLDSEPNHLGADFRQALFNHTGGHPLFTIELLRNMVERGDITQEDGIWVQASSLDWRFMPARVEGVIDERLNRLEENLYQLLQVASVEGVRFTSQVLARVQGIDDLRLLRLLKHELENRHRLVRELEEVQVGDHWLGCYTFTHILIQQHIYSRLSEGERRLLHRSIGETLEKYYEGQETEIAVRLALHFAGDPVKERLYAGIAGKQAARKFANDEALAYFNRALALTPASDPAGRYQLLLSRESIHNLLGNRESQRRDLEELKTLAAKMEGTHSSPGKAEAAERWANYISHTDYQGAVQLAKEAATLAESEGRLDVAVKAYSTWSFTLLVQGAHEEAIQKAEAGILLAREDSNLRGESVLLNMLGLISLDMGESKAARAYFENCLAMANQLGDRQIEAQSLNNLGNTTAKSGDYRLSRNYYQRALQLAQEVGNRRGESLVLGNLGWLSGLMGDFKTAVSHFEQQRVIAENIRDLYQQTWVAINLSMALLAQGNPEKALAYASEGLEIAGETGDRSGEAWTLTSLGHIHFEIGDLAVAETNYQQAVEIRYELKQPNLATEPLAGLARIASQRGELQAAQEKVAEILAYLDAGGSLVGTEEPLRVLLTCCRVLKSVDDSRAAEVLTDAYALLMERADKITDEGLRTKFLENIPAHREVLDAWRNCGDLA